ncbi:MAG: hypothetical protein ABIB47_02300 [Candidatus Woesearchaeota archaeon]
MKDKIENKNGLNVQIEQKGVSEPSKIFCDQIEYISNKKDNVFDHHLFFWNKGELIFKVWLPNNKDDKEFEDIYEALKSVDILVKEDE